MNKLVWVGRAVEKGGGFPDPQSALEAEFAWAEGVWRNAMCFDFGEQSDTLGYAPNPDVIRLPFETIWAEFSAVTECKDLVRFGLLCRTERVDHDGLDGTHRFKWQMWHVSTGHVGIVDWGFASDVGKVMHHEEDGFNGLVAVHALRRALTVMACSNVMRVETKPSTMERALAAKRKVPAFSTWTLHIRPRAGVRVDHGGTHSSPRVHLRRGHIRQCASGVSTWVQPCVVGDPQRGSVAKDYQLDVPRQIAAR